MSASSALVHPLTSLRAKLEELARREDADQLERLLEGEGMPLLGGQEEPAELLHRALLRKPFQPELVLSLAPLLTKVLKRLAAALEKETLPPSPALGRTVRNALLLAELVPPAAPIFEGVAAIYVPLAAYAADAEREEDRYALGQRLRAALSCQQDDEDFINLHLRGMIFLSQGNLAEAKRLFEQGLEQCKLEGQRGYFRNALAVLALRQARWDDVDQLVSADASPVGKVLQFHARAGSGRAEDASQLALELQAAKILPFPVRRAFEGIRDGYDVFAPSGLRNPSPEEEERIFEYEFEMLSSGIAA